VPDPLGGNPKAQHRRDVVLTSNDRTMGEDAADIGHQTLGLGEQLRPGRRGHRAHEDGAGLHLREIGRGQHQAGARGNLAGTAGVAVQAVAVRVVGGLAPARPPAFFRWHRVRCHQPQARLLKFALLGDTFLEFRQRLTRLARRNGLLALFQEITHMAALVPIANKSVSF